MDETSGANILLLEDLSGSARAGCLVCGCSWPEARAAVISLAKFHARWWNSERLAQFDWLQHKRDWVTDTSQEQYATGQKELLERIHTEMPEFDCSPAFLRTASALEKNYTRLKKYIYSAPVTLIHDDYHLDNMLFRGDGEEVEPVIIDWQCVIKGPAVCDLRYFLDFCLSPEQREQGENELLQTYYQVLCTNGVEGYELNRFLLDYHLSLLEPFERLIIVRGVLNRAYPRGLAIFEAVLSRMKPIFENSQITELIGSPI
jgi:Ser/Thr protein kinase RdoA (MazF antagonist)